MKRLAETDTLPYIIMSMGTTTAKKISSQKQDDLLLNLRKLAEKIPASEMKKIPKNASTTYKQHLYGQSK